MVLFGNRLKMFYLFEVTKLPLGDIKVNHKQWGNCISPWFEFYKRNGCLNYGFYA